MCYFRREQKTCFHPVYSCSEAQCPLGIWCSQGWNHPAEGSLWKCQHAEEPGLEAKLNMDKGKNLVYPPKKSLKLVSYTKLIMESNSLWITRGKTPVGLTWCLYTLVVVRVHTHLVLLRMKGKLAQVYSTQLVVGLQVRPAPQPAVDHMGKAFSVRYLQTAIQRPAQTVQGDNETTGPIKVTT